jgi:hypothetical protein
MTHTIYWFLASTFLLVSCGKDSPQPNQPGNDPNGTSLQHNTYAGEDLLAGECLLDSIFFFNSNGGQYRAFKYLNKKQLAGYLHQATGYGTDTIRLQYENSQPSKAWLIPGGAPKQRFVAAYFSYKQGLLNRIYPHNEDYANSYERSQGDSLYYDSQNRLYHSVLRLGGNIIATDKVYQYDQIGNIVQLLHIPSNDKGTGLHSDVYRYEIAYSKTPNKFKGLTNLKDITHSPLLNPILFYNTGFDIPDEVWADILFLSTNLPTSITTSKKTYHQNAYFKYKMDSNGNVTSIAVGNDPNFDYSTREQARFFYRCK